MAQKEFKNVTIVELVERGIIAPGTEMQIPSADRCHWDERTRIDVIEPKGSDGYYQIYHSAKGGDVCSCEIQKTRLDVIIFNPELTKKNDMQKLNAMMKRLLDEDTKKLYKAGFIDGDLKLTDEGKSMLDAIVYDQHKAAMVAAAEEAIAEVKEDR